VPLDKQAILVFECCRCPRRWRHW